jgi:hypothetical protein
MTDYTHYYLIVGDGHIKGRRSPTMVDPVVGVTLTHLGPTQPVVNTIGRGATSGAVMRVTKIHSTSLVEGEAIVAVSISAFIPGETINWDSGGSATVGVFVQASDVPQTAQYAPERYDAITNAQTPSDASDTPWWDQGAKLARTITVASGFTGTFVKGDRCTCTSGAAFTVLKVTAGAGGTLNLYVMRVTGSPVVSDVITNTTRAGSGTIAAVQSDTPTGAWVQHHCLPNIGGAGADLYEVIPNGNATSRVTNLKPGLGLDIWVTQQAFAKHNASASGADRGARVLTYSTFDQNTSGVDGNLGGVTIQTVKCTGTFGNTWVIGETVTSGSWSAVVHGFSESNKYVFVRRTNGETLAAGTITGSTSGTTATATGPAYGWQPGSLYWNQFWAQHAAATGASNALRSGSPIKYEHLAAMMWETEIGPINSAIGAPWPTETQVVQEWESWITAMRTALGRPDLPVSLLNMDVRSQGGTIFGVPFSYFLRSVQVTMRDQIPGIILVSTDGFQPGTTASTNPSTLLVYRTEDYIELGRRLWRAMEYAEWIPGTGNFEPLPIVLVLGQSQAVSAIPGTFMALDLDPDLYPSAYFPGVSTIDPDVWIWNANDLVKSWENLDCATNGNTFFGQAPGTFSGITTVLAQRFKRRFSNDDGSAQVAFIHLPVSSASAYGGAPVPWTFDPQITGQQQVSGNYTVTAYAASGSNPARGRFTATTGTFAGWDVGGYVNVAGSALGLLGAGGNNHANYNNAQIYAISGDGSWIEIIGAFVNEGPESFTLSYGPWALWPLAEAQIEAALEKCVTQLRRIPRPAGWVWWNGESDVSVSEFYQAALNRIIERIDLVFGMRVKGDGPIPGALLELTPNTPVGTDEQVTAIIAAQRAIAAARPNTVSIDTSKLPLQISGTAWPRTTRQQNGIHHTMRGYLMAGYMTDKAMGTLTGIPEHPDGDAAVDFGAVGGGYTSGAGTDTIGTDSTLIIEDGSGVDGANAFFDTPYVDAYNDNHDQVTEWAAGSVDDKQKWIRQGTAYVARQYASRWPGVRAYQNQSLPWPRYGVVDSDGYAVSSSSIPVGILEACAEASVKAASGALFLTDEAGGSNLQSETLTLDVLTLSSVFVGSKGNQTRFVSIDQILMAAGLINAGLRVRRS